MLAPALALLLLASPPAQPAPAFAPKHRPYDVQRYSLTLRLKEGGAFDASVAITLVPGAALPVLELDSYGLAIKSVSKQGGGALPFTRKDDPAQRTGWLRVTPPAPFARGAPVTIVVAYSGQASTDGDGFFTLTDPDEKGALPGYFTSFEPSSARRFFPCNDEPADKALTEVEAVVDARYQVLANGAKVKDEEFTEGGQRLRRVKWVQDKPHSTYLVGVDIGRFEAVPVGSGVPATIWVGPGQANRTPAARDMTKAALESEAAFVGVPYPWAKHDQVAAPGYEWQGMENTSLVLLQASRLVLSAPDVLTEVPGQTLVIAHELAHQWFGNLVTCQWWDDTWLNEGFATYLAWVTQEAFYRNDLARVGRAARTINEYFREEDGPRAHPLLARGAATPEDVFDPISYSKGAGVLRMLEQWLGTDAFRKGLKAYLETYAYKNATSAQFFAVMGKAAGKEKEVQAFAQAWTSKRGYPVLSPKAQWTGKSVKLTVAQRPNHPEEKGPFVFQLPVVLSRARPPVYRKTVMLRMDKPVVEQEVELPAAPEWVDWNEGASALARIEDGAVSEAEWTQASRQEADPVWRMMADLALLGPLLDPKAPQAPPPSPMALGSLAAALARDYSPYVRHAVLERMGIAPRRWLPVELAPVVFSLAQQPTGLPEGDLIGAAMVRKAALEALGRFDYARAQDLLVRGVAQEDLPVDLLTGYAVGAARVGTPQAIQALQAALDAQRARGELYHRAVAEAFGAIESPQGFGPLAGVLKRFAGNGQLASRIIRRLRDNTARRSPEGVRFVRDFVLGGNGFSDEVKDRMLRVLDDVKTPEAQQALAEIAKKSDSERQRGNARRVLEKNFGAGAVPR